MTLPIFDKPAAWADYDATARALPDCEHNQAWWKQGPGRPQPPDCVHNRRWRAALHVAWLTYLAALDNERAGLWLTVRTGITAPAWAVSASAPRNSSKTTRTGAAPNAATTTTRDRRSAHVTRVTLPAPVP